MGDQHPSPNATAGLHPRLSYTAATTSSIAQLPTPASSAPAIDTHTHNRREHPPTHTHAAQHPSGTQHHCNNFASRSRLSITATAVHNRTLCKRWTPAEHCVAHRPCSRQTRKGPVQLLTCCGQQTPMRYAALPADVHYAAQGAGCSAVLSSTASWEAVARGQAVRLRLKCRLYCCAVIGWVAVVLAVALPGLHYQSQCAARGPPHSRTTLPPAAASTNQAC